MPILDKETRQLINASRTLGSGVLSIFLKDNELLRLCAVIAADLGQPGLVPGIADIDELARGYYGLELDWFRLPVPSAIQFEPTFLALKGAIEDFGTYFKSLCELHKRRMKFQLILEHQPLAHLDQIVPRCLLEFGLRPSAILASWLIWRKWMYDVDNRAAQETGYLFEPILAAAIGGLPFSAAVSPVRRAEDQTKGRQVDCLDGQLAYEFKMRVTIAASGQGRFQEELDFARDCQASGFIPILLVLDPTPSVRLTALHEAYAKYGGMAYIGDAAWAHLIEKAGPAMGRFIEKYIRLPLQAVVAADVELQPIQLSYADNRVRVQIAAQPFEVGRAGEGLNYADTEQD